MRQPLLKTVPLAGMWWRSGVLAGERALDLFGKDLIVPEPSFLVGLEPWTYLS
jgi:hypothetical protein